MPNRIFLDTSFVVALINERDQYYQQAEALSYRFNNSSLITTYRVLLEIGNGLVKNYKKEAIEKFRLASYSETQVMWENGLTEALTFDDNFEQVEFIVLKS